MADVKLHSYQNDTHIAPLQQERLERIRDRTFYNDKIEKCRHKIEELKEIIGEQNDIIEELLEERRAPVLTEPPPLSEFEPSEDGERLRLQRLKDTLLKAGLRPRQLFKP